VENDDRILKLWDALFGSDDGKREYSREVLPWEGSLLDMARNHHARKDVGSHIGDVLFYSQCHLAYIARKIILFEDTDNKKLRTIPECFFNGSRRFILSERIRKLVWELGSEVFQSATPAGSKPPSYRMSIERLKYEDCFSDVEKMTLLLKNSSDIWSRIGRKVDDQKKTAAGPLNRRYVSDLFGLLCQIPGIRFFVRRLNEFFRSSSKMESIEDNAKIIGQSHTDGRLITCCSSVRHSIKTEIFDGKNWIELPLTRDLLAIIPGSGLENYGIYPTMHRVLHLTGTNRSASTGTNKTLILGLRYL